MDQARSRTSSTVAEARRRAGRVKAVLVASAVALFALVGVAVRAAHPGTASSGGTRATTQLNTPSDFEKALSQDDDFSQGGFIAPAGGPPAASTSTS